MGCNQASMKIVNVVVQFIVFHTLSTLICRGTDISKYISEFLGIRDNESRLYFYFYSLQLTLHVSIDGCQNLKYENTMYRFYNM